ncbi:hypothetical protein CHS0354_038129 [Potamilus streckersoni]|uniref:Homeobox domain-containing protein n=1 Tax=Potamilus streckersoni TaxID=2493646 RepID=A0AAE0SJH0_9BIVA|nr:hypothetical protein CHS0354_038129 [Potamilus streckersoni]
MQGIKPEVDGSDSLEEKNENNLSFSISRILGDDREKKENITKELEFRNDFITPKQPQYCSIPGMGMASTIHHYGQVLENPVGQHNRMRGFPFSYPMISPLVPLVNSLNRISISNSPTAKEYQSNCACANKERPDSDGNFCTGCNNSGNETDEIEDTQEVCETPKDASDMVFRKKASSQVKVKKKKTRTVFSRSQVYQLESAFDMKRYLSSTERSGLAARLNLSETQIKIWFQNRRNKWKRQINGEMDEIPPSSFPQIHGALLSPFLSPTLNNFHVSNSREELYRGGVATPALYSHPYANKMIPRY